MLLGLAVLLSVAAGVAAGAGEIGVDDRTVAVADRTTVPVTLDDAPEGLQRYNVTVAVASPDVATIEAAAAGDVEGFQVRSQSDEAVTFRAADLSAAVGDGARNVTLGTVTVTGATPGETTLSVTAHEVRTDAGEQTDPALSTGTLTVEADGSDGGSAACERNADAAPVDTGGEAAGGDGDSGALDRLDATLPGPLASWVAGTLGVLVLVLVGLVAWRG